MDVITVDDELDPASVVQAQVRGVVTVMTRDAIYHVLPRHT